MDVELFGALIQALNLCCQEALRNELHDFGTTSDRFIIHRRADWGLYIVGKVDRIDTDESIIPRLQHILAQFEKCFQMELKNFNSNVAVFANFKYNLTTENINGLSLNSSLSFTALE